MGLKLFLFFAFAAVLMDPCDKKPRNIELSQVTEACSSEAGRMFVRVKGRIQPASEIVCKDHPGGRRCALTIGTESGEEMLPVLIRGSEKREGQDRYESTLTAPQGTSRGSLEPYSVGFDEAELYDREGKLVNHVNGVVALAGSLQIGESSDRCSLLVLRVESGVME